MEQNRFLRPSSYDRPPGRHPTRAARNERELRHAHTTPPDLATAPGPRARAGPRGLRQRRGRRRRGHGQRHVVRDRGPRRRPDGHRRLVQLPRVRDPGGDLRAGARGRRDLRSTASPTSAPASWSSRTWTGGTSTSCPSTSARRSRWASGETTADSTTPRPTTATCSPTGVSVLEPSEAQDRNVFVVTSEFSDSNGVTAIPDLADAGDLTLAGGPECEDREPPASRGCVGATASTTSPSHHRRELAPPGLAARTASAGHPAVLHRPGLSRTVRWWPWRTPRA